MWSDGNSIVASVVFAQQIADEQQDWSLQFEKLLTETWEDNRLVYTVSPWESLWSIARQFATSTKELLKANNITDKNLLRPWQKIVISYAENQLIYEIEESSSLTDFAELYELNIEELMSLNFLANADYRLQEWDQLLLDISIPEAQRKNLYQKPEYETPEELLALDIPFVADDFEEPVDEQIVDVFVPVIENWDVNQKIISAEETTNTFDTEEQRKIQEIRNKEIAAEQAILAKQKEDEESKKAQNVIADTKPVVSTVPVQQVPVQQKIIEAQATSSQCGSNKCFYKWKCRNLPANASCAESSVSEARTCKPWYKEYASQCVTNAIYEKKKEIEKAEAITKPAKYGVVSQRYFNPSADWYNNGWARWHCTHGAGRRRWKNYGIMTNRRWNGGKWYYNASAAWWQVGQTPEVWAIFSTQWAAQNGRYWHVGVVTQVDRASGSMMVVDMNYVWKATFSQRRVSIKMPGLIGFIYPRKK